MNHLILFFHVLTVGSFSLIALYLGKEALAAWLGFLAVAMNFFIHKQITLFGLEVTASDALSIGYLLGMNLIQEFFGKEQARKTTWISLFIACSFVTLSQIHLLYQPNAADQTQSHFLALLHLMPRTVYASLFCFLIVQVFDQYFFNFLKHKLHGKFLFVRMMSTLMVSEILDTVLFSYLGLYGVVSSLLSVILFSLVVKGCVIVLMGPFISFSKKVVVHV